MMQRITWLGLLLALFSLLLPACSTLAAPDAPSQAPSAAPTGSGTDPYGGKLVLTSVSLESLTIDGQSAFLPVVKARVGTIDCTFIVDTGAVITGITPSLATRLGLTPKPLLPNGQKTVFGKTIDVVTIPTIKLGDINFASVQVQVYADSDWNSLNKFPVDGIISLQGLEFCIVEFDFLYHRLTFLNPHVLTEEVRHKAGYGLASYSADIKKNDYGLYEVVLELTKGEKHSSETATLDTGSLVTQVSAKVAGIMGLTSTGPPVAFGGFRKAEDLRASHVDQMRLGQLRLSDVLVRHPQKDDFLAAGPVFGMDILSGYKVLLDFPAKKMYLQPPATVAPPVQVKPSIPKAP